MDKAVEDLAINDRHSDLSSVLQTASHTLIPVHSVQQTNKQEKQDSQIENIKYAWQTTTKSTSKQVNKFVNKHANIQAKKKINKKREKQTKNGPLFFSFATL